MRGLGLEGKVQLWGAQAWGHESWSFPNLKKISREMNLFCVTAGLKPRSSLQGFYMQQQQRQQQQRQKKQHEEHDNKGEKHTNKHHKHIICKLGPAKQCNSGFF